MDPQICFGALLACNAGPKFNLIWMVVSELNECHSASAIPAAAILLWQFILFCLT